MSDRHREAVQAAAELIRREWVCGCVERSKNPDDWHECCRYSEFAARNALRITDMSDDEVHELSQAYGYSELLKDPEYQRGERARRVRREPRYVRRERGGDREGS